MDDALSNDVHAAESTGRTIVLCQLRRMPTDYLNLPERQAVVT